MEIRPGKADCFGNVNSWFIVGDDGAPVASFVDDLYNLPPVGERAKVRAARELMERCDIQLLRDFEIDARGDVVRHLYGIGAREDLSAGLMGYAASPWFATEVEAVQWLAGPEGRKFSRSLAA